MKIKFLAIILALSCAAVVTGQNKPRCPEKVSYDKFEDKTTEVCGGFAPSSKKGESFSMFGLNAVVEYKGQERLPPFFVSLTLIASGGQLQGYPKLRFDDVKSMFILADTGRAELPVTEYKQSGNELQEGHFVIETATIPLSQAAINYLLTAKTVEARLGPEEFKFDADALRTFQDYLRMILPPLKAPTTPTKTTPRRKRPLR